jgi:hypothetical protein
MKYVATPGVLSLETLNTSGLQGKCGAMRGKPAENQYSSATFFSFGMHSTRVGLLLLARISDFLKGISLIIM